MQQQLNECAESRKGKATAPQTFIGSSETGWRGAKASHAEAEWHSEIQNIDSVAAGKRKTAFGGVAGRIFSHILQTGVIIC